MRRIDLITVLGRPHRRRTREIEGAVGRVLRLLIKLNVLPGHAYVGDLKGFAAPVGVGNGFRMLEAFDRISFLSRGSEPATTEKRRVA